MFTGASQFAFVGVVGAGGSAWAGAATAVLLGTRNALYWIAAFHRPGCPGLRRLVASHLVIDETTAMAIARDERAESRFAFWITGLILFCLWNLGTLIGALATQVLPDPKALGLDAAPPAAFLALIAPRHRGRGRSRCGGRSVVCTGLPAIRARGVPLLIVALLVAVIGVRPAR